MFIHNLAENHVTGALTSKQICDSDVCTSALIGRPGFVCVAEPYGNNTQRCAIMYYCDHQSIDCGKHGHCYVETEIQSERVSYSSKCRWCSINLTSVKNGFFFVIKLMRTICCLHPFICFVFSDSFVIKQEPPTKLTVFNISFCIFHFLLNNIFCIYAAIINVFFFNLKKKCIYTCTWNIKITLLHWFHISSVCTVHACTTFATTTCM